MHTVNHQLFQNFDHLVDIESLVKLKPLVSAFIAKNFQYIIPTKFAAWSFPPAYQHIQGIADANAKYLNNLHSFDNEFQTVIQNLSDTDCLGSFCLFEEDVVLASFSFNVRYNLKGLPNKHLASCVAKRPIDSDFDFFYNWLEKQDIFEEYVIQVYFNQLTFGRKIMEPLSPRLKEKADQLASNKDYEFRHLEKSEIAKLAEYLRVVYNKAWANRAENPELTQQQTELMVKQMKPIMDNKLLYFGFFKGEPISFFLSLPEINQIFKYVNGKLDLIGKAKLVYHTLLKTNKKAFGILFGIVPEHQGKGADGAMIQAARAVLQDKYKRYDEYEMNWIGDFNPKMILVVEQVGAKVSKKHITYRKLFDETKPFKRHPILK